MNNGLTPNRIANVQLLPSDHWYYISPALGNTLLSVRGLNYYIKRFKKSLHQLTGHILMAQLCYLDAYKLSFGHDDGPNDLK